jgi:hypothetical protein
VTEDSLHNNPKVFKLITGEEIITTVVDTKDNFFMIEVPLEIRFNSIKQSLFLTRWKFGANYTKVMTLSGGSVVSVSEPEDLVLENYYAYREQLTSEYFNKDPEDEKMESFDGIDDLFEELNSEDTIH